MQDRGFDPTDSGAVFVCLASGAEKLLKLSLGLLELEVSGSWPSQQQMRTEWGHDLETMDRVARGKIYDRRHLSNAQAYLEGLLQTVETNPVLQQVLRVLGTYALAGRFHNLDALADEPTRPTPRDLWQNLESQLVLSDPGLLHQLFDAHGGQTARKTFNSILDEALADWQRLYVRAWQHAIFGKQAQRWSAQLALMSH